MKIKVTISKLVAADQEYVTSFGPSGDKRMSKLEYYVENILLPMEREEFKEIFARGFRSHQLTDLRDMIMYSLKTIFEAEFRKKEETEKSQPGEELGQDNFFSNILRTHSCRICMLILTGRLSTTQSLDRGI